MALPLLFDISYTLQTIAAAATIFAACLLFSQVNHGAQLAKLPTLIKEGSSEDKRVNYLKSAKQMYSKGYRQFRDSAYRMATSDGVDTVVVPPEFLPELRKLPDSVLSIYQAIDDVLESKYTKIKSDQPAIIHAIKADLTPALVRLNPHICAEADEALREEMPPCEDWTGVYIYMTLVNVIAKVSGRVFVGPELCHDKAYLDAGINYTMELMNAQRVVKEMRPWLRPFLASRLPEVQLLRRREKQAKDFLNPIVQARRDAEKNPDYQKPDDLLQWLLNRGSQYHVDTTAELAAMQLSVTFAAIHTTTMTATNTLYTLATYPEYIQPLREEIRAAMAENAGVITSRALQSMVKLDSFMKETVRFNGVSFTSFARKVVKGITISNGQYIPPGVLLEVPSYAIYQDSANYPESHTFDGFRFAKLRQASNPTGMNHNQFVTSNEQSLFFGYGKHTCPGRFFATNEIKMILARIILEYDIQNVDGVNERIPNIEAGKGTMPDATKQLMFKKVPV